MAEQALAAQGMAAITTENGDAVTWPAGAAVFQTQGGQCFVHGGASPQEMIVPLLRIKAERGKVETRPAKIEVVGTLRKITNLLTPLEFYQTEAIGDIVKAMTYRLFFVDKENESISAQQVFYADHREKEPAKRIQKLRFRFKNQKYDSDALYYLVAVAEDGMELFRQEVRMDIIFADDFGFEL